MSFGFSVGDFIAAIELANKLRKEFIGAPGQFKDISDEVRNLSIILQDLEVVLSKSELDSQQQTDLQRISGSNQNVLTDLEKTIGKYGELEVGGGSLGKKLKRVWKRLKWEPDDIRELRDRITSNATLLNTFLGRISSEATFATKRGVNRLNQRQDDQDRLASLDWLTPIDYTSQQNDFINRR
ncbi:hypothetical protein HD806DRAFT_537623 [Xylariaceae sp. AK1471]|nr:hypothetical protein HD806DRAFT_537623 [Xylariaceae sp. AK1471]